MTWAPSIGDAVSFRGQADSKVTVVETGSSSPWRNHVRVQNSFQSGAQGQWVDRSRLVKYGDNTGPESPMASEIVRNPQPATHPLAGWRTLQGRRLVRHVTDWAARATSQPIPDIGRLYVGTSSGLVVMGERPHDPRDEVVAFRNDGSRGNDVVMDATEARAMAQHLLMTHPARPDWKVQAQGPDPEGAAARVLAQQLIWAADSLDDVPNHCGGW